MSTSEIKTLNTRCKAMERLVKELGSEGEWHGIIIVDSECKILQDAFTFENAMRLLPLEQQAQVLHKRLFPDRCKALCNRILQIVGCSLVTGVHPAQLKFTQGKYGKPQLEEQGISFSMSHGQQHVGQYICRSNDHREVGIDMASTGDYMGNEDLTCFRDVFSTQEMECLLKCDFSQRQAMFTYMWSLKECYTKYTGLGLNSDLAGINFGNLDLLQPSSFIQRRIGDCTISFYSQWTSETEILTVCHEEKGSRVPSTYYLTLSELLFLLQDRAERYPNFEGLSLPKDLCKCEHD